MNDNNTTNEKKKPIRITNQEEYLKLKEENSKNSVLFFNEEGKKVDRAKRLGHPLAYVCDYIGATVSVVDIIDAEKLLEIRVGNGALAIDINEINKYAYVTNFFDNTISVINTTYNKVLKNVPVGINPAGVKVSKDGKALYVVHFGEPNIYVMDATTLNLITKIPLPYSGFQLDITKCGSLAFVSLHQAGKVAVVDLNINLVVKVFDTGNGAEDVKISPTSPLVFISNEYDNNLTPVNIDLAEPANTPIETGSFPVGIAFNTGGRKLYVANRYDDTVSVIDVFTHREIAKIKVGKEPYGATATCGGRLVIITNFSDNNLSVIDTKIDKVIHTAPTGVGPAFLAILKKAIRAN